MVTQKFLRLSALTCFAAIMLTVVAEAQPGGGRGQRGGGEGGQRGGGRGQRGGGEGGQRGGGPGGQRGGQRGGFGGQRGGGQRGGGSISRAQLLGLEDVRDELDVDEGQAAVLDAALEAYQEERNEARGGFDFSKIREMSDEERQEVFAKMRKEQEKLAKKTDETLNALLEPEQVTRLDEISFQLKARGSIADLLAEDEELRKKLNVTEEQVKAMEEARKAGEESMQKLQDEVREAFRNNQGEERPDFTAMREKMDSARKENEKKTDAILTDEQRKKIETMKGEPFEIDMRSLFSRGGGRGGDRGGDRGGRGGGGDRGGRQGGGGGGDRGDRGGRGRPPVEDDNA